MLLSTGSADGGEAAAPDDSGGAVVIWNDRRAGVPQSVYAQRLDRDGNRLWATGGVLMRQHAGLVGPISAVEDGNAGAIAVWRGTGGALYLNMVTAQRVDSRGVPRWGQYGVTVIGSNEDRGFLPAVVADGAGGAVVGWEMFNHDWPELLDSVAVCRLDNNGTILWATEVTVDTLFDYAALPLAVDGQGGAYVGWTASTFGVRSVRMQHVNSAGNLLWDTSGVRPCTTGRSHYAGPAVPAGSNSVVVGWIDSSGGTWQLTAQKLSPNGQLMWNPAGVPIRTNARGPMWNGCAVPSTSGATTWCWMDKEDSTYAVYAQKLDSVGRRLWDTCGILVGHTNYDEFRDVAAVPDRSGGAIVVWNRFVNNRNWDVYAQHVDASGRVLWGDSGLAVCRDTNIQEWTPKVVTDGQGGAIAAWGDCRFGPPPSTDVYAQRFGDDVAVSEQGRRPPGARFTVRPNPATRCAEFRWPAANGGRVTISDAAGRLVAVLCGSPSRLGESRAQWNGVDGRGITCPAGVYFCILQDTERTAVCRLSLMGSAHARQ